MNEIQKEILNLIQEKKDKENSTRINVSLTPSENRRIELLAKVLNVSKQQLIERLFSAALRDIETELGLTNDPEYLEMISSQEPVVSYLDRIVAVISGGSK